MFSTKGICFEVLIAYLSKQNVNNKLSIYTLFDPTAWNICKSAPSACTTRDNVDCGAAHHAAKVLSDRVSKPF